MQKTEQSIILAIIKDLETTSDTQKNIAKRYNVSESLVEKINRCQTYTELHSYENNIRRELKHMNSSLINNYYEKDDCYELEIINTNNKNVKTYIDKDDYERVKQYKWSLSIHGNDIRVICSQKGMNRQYLHQFVMKNTEKNKVVDHIDRNPLNNRKNNLRIVSRSINSTNAKPRTESKSGIRGVYFRPARPGVARASWICEWSDNSGRHSKSFSISKYGEEEAFRLAASLREQKMKEMKIQSGPMATQE